MSQPCVALEKLCANVILAVHVFNTPEHGLAAIPALLDVRQPQSSSVDAVVVGGGFSDADYDALRVACGDGKTVPWFKADRRHFASMPPLDRPEAFGVQAAGRIKARLIELRVGQTEGEPVGEHLF
jgi:hypothetical protein